MLFRITGKKIVKKFGGQISKSCLEIYNDQIEKINQLSEETVGLMDNYDFPEALNKIEEIIYLGNHCLSINEFWSMDDPEPVLYLTLETMRVVSILLQPFIPNQATKVLDFLEEDQRNFSNAKINLSKSSYAIDVKKIKNLHL